MSGSLPMNFRLSADERIRATIIGVPAWSRRKREIEDRLERAIAVLAEMRRAGVPSGKIAATAEEHLAPINDLISRHNRWYPIEAELPVDIRTGRLMERGGAEPWLPMTPLTVAALLARAG